MKNTNIKAIVSVVAISALALLASRQVSADFIPVLAVTVSYVAVTLLFVLAALDSKGKRGPKGYSMR